jgi:hypothetical protein
MKKALYGIILVFSASIFTPAVFAQIAAHNDSGDHVNIGVFGNYFREDETSTNLAGLGGRLSVNLTGHLQLEAEISYNFDQVFTEGFSTPGDPTVTLVRTNFRSVDGLVGPKLMTNKGPVRLFATIKGGGLSFHFDPRAANFNTFASTVGNLRASDVNPVLYPGVGAEAFWGPIGMRFDVGDEIYFNHGAHNGLRASFGPVIRF